MQRMWTASISCTISYFRNTGLLVNKERHNMRISERDRNIQLEDIMDQFTLPDMISAIEDLCHEKADHIRANSWQTMPDDEALAKEWEKCAKVLSRAVRAMQAVEKRRR